MKYTEPLLLLSLLVLLSGCGSSKSIKSYSYPITKDKLENAVLKVIHTNPHIVIDTTQATVIVRRNPKDTADTSTVIINLSDFHSADSANMAARYKAVIKIKIKVGEIENDYIFRYLGDEKYWENSASSAIFIQQVTDKHGNSINQGKNDNNEFNSKMATEFTSLFEEEVVSKIDKELNLKHTND